MHRLSSLKLNVTDDDQFKTKKSAFLIFRCKNI